MGSSSASSGKKRNNEASRDIQGFKKEKELRIDKGEEIISRSRLKISIIKNDHDDGMKEILNAIAQMNPLVVQHEEEIETGKEKQAQSGDGGKYEQEENKEAMLAIGTKDRNRIG